MKKILLSVLIIVAVMQVKAQQMQMNGALKSMDTNIFKMKIDSNWLYKQKLNFSSLQLNSNPELLAQLTPLNSTQVKFYRRMPVLIPNLNNYKMPVIKTDKPGEHYQILIKKIDEVKQDTVIRP